MATKSKAKPTASVAEKLESLEKLQRIDSEIDRILTIRGELPLEVEDLEDEVLGLETRIKNTNEELEAIEQEINDRKNAQKDAQTAIMAYKEKQTNVRNNREYESLSKEIEFQELEIQLHEKKTKEAKYRAEQKAESLKETQDRLEIRKGDLEAKRKELDEIVAETQKEEEELRKQSAKAQEGIDDSLMNAYNRLRLNSKNGLAVVSIDRDACGGCFNRIPPQRQMDIMQRKKIIVCEHCGRILTPNSPE
jgi:uncharacterized protein